MTRSTSSVARRIGPVLLVDDYDDARTCVRDGLENAGYRVVEAADGLQALHLLVGADEHFALIILDLQMPVMDGWQLLELLRRYVALSKTPVIVLTAHEARFEQQHYPNIFGYIQSPYKMEDLIKMVDDCMAGARKPRSEQAAGPKAK